MRAALKLAAAAAAALLLGTTPSSANVSTSYREYDFTGSTVDTTIWSIYNPPAPLITVKGGVLHVGTQGKQGSGLCLCRGSARPTAPYGEWDVRVKSAANVDHGFAILMWPNDNNWPSEGEIDLAEPNPDRTKVDLTLHYGATNQRYRTSVYGDFTQWHTFGVRWTSTSVQWLIDGVVKFTVTDPAAVPTHVLHLALQAGTISTVTNPSNTYDSLDVQWVRVRQ